MRIPVCMPHVIPSRTIRVFTGNGAFAAILLGASIAGWSPVRGIHRPVRMDADAGSAPVPRPATVVRVVSCQPLPDIPGKSITTATVTFPPNALSPRHHHPGSVTAYVLEGVLRSQLAGEPVASYAAGQAWFEPPGAIHLFAENASATEPAELLAVSVTDADCGPLTIFD